VEVERRSICSIRKSGCLFGSSFYFQQILLKLYRNVIGGVAGLTADANSLVNYARTAAQRHLLAYNEDIPVELLAQRLCDMKQGYTQFGGAPFIMQKVPDPY